MGAIDFLRRMPVMRQHFPHELAMTTLAIGIQNRFAALADPNRFGKIIQGKTFGMQKAALCFDEILGNQCFRCVTIIARRNGVVTSLFPRIVMVIHDVAIFACRGIVR